MRDFGRLKREAMRRDLKHRLQAVEVADPKGIEIWIEEGDGSVRGPLGERTTRKELEALRHAAGPFVLVISEDDAQL